jgi:hypothetical protein
VHFGRGLKLGVKLGSAYQCCCHRGRFEGNPVVLFMHCAQRVLNTGGMPVVVAATSGSSIMLNVLDREFHA